MSSLKSIYQSGSITDVMASFNKKKNIVQKALVGRHELTYFGYMMRKDGPEKKNIYAWWQEKEGYPVKEITQMG